MNTNSVSEKAHAKLNLVLEILNKRPDGYHDLASVMVTTTLADTVTVRSADTLTLVPTRTWAGAETDLVLKAARRLAEVAAVSDGASIKIDKRIPPASGLGGGSADAAATLRALNRLWHLNYNNQQLAKLGAKIGSDVPFLVHGGAATVYGRGEVVIPLPVPNIGWVVIVSPTGAPADKTRQMFNRVQEHHYSSGGLAHKLGARIRGGGDCPPELFSNAFLALAGDVFPGWSDIYAEFLALGAREVFLTGAGPSMFALTSTREVASVWSAVMQVKFSVATFSVRLVAPSSQNELSQ